MTPADLAAQSSRDPVAALTLHDLMSELSERCWFAGWLQGLEHALWAMVNGGAREYGQGIVSDEEVARLRELSERSGGWWRWDEVDDEVFVPIEAWRRIAPPSKR